MLLKKMYDELVKSFNAIQSTDTNDLILKGDDNTKINVIKKEIADHDYSNKHSTTQEFIRLTTDNFAARLKQAILASKNNIDDFVKKECFDEKQIIIEKLI